MSSAPMELLGPPPGATQAGIATATPNGGSCVDPLAFAALVERAVAVAGAAVAAGTPLEAPAADQEAGPDGATDDDTGEAPTDGPPILGLDVTLLAMLLAGAVPAGAPAPVPPAGAGPVLTPDTAGTPATGVAATDVPQDATPSATPAGTPADADTDTATADPAAPAPRPEQPAARPEPATAAAPPATADARPVDPGTVPVVTGGHVSVASTPVDAPAGEAPVTRSVAAQVIPEITRLVSDGEGVHRVTLQLNPRALGEVRVVLTLRHGEVHVRIAGGEEARQAVAASSAELTRALHSVGIDEHRLTLTDLPAASATRSSGHETPDQSRHHQHSTGGHQHDQHGQNSHSRMGDARSATDGSSTSNPTARTSGAGRVHEAGRTRTPGEVDLRM